MEKDNKKKNKDYKVIIYLIIALILGFVLDFVVITRSDATDNRFSALAPNELIENISSIVCSNKEDVTPDNGDEIIASRYYTGTFSIELEDDLILETYDEEFDDGMLVSCPMYVFSKDGEVVLNIQIGGIGGSYDFDKEVIDISFGDGYIRNGCVYINTDDNSVNWYFNTLIMSGSYSDEELINIAKTIEPVRVY